ncbi:MAG TPA: hypothetical protein VJB09_01795 [Candidatus Paceibacterota bacterium]
MIQDNNCLPTPGRCCQHGVNILNGCPKCLEDSRISVPWRIIETLDAHEYSDKSAERNGPSYNFQVPASMDTEGRFSGQVFSINQVQGPSDPRLDEVLSFLGKQFNENVLNQKEDFKRKLLGKTRYGDDRPAYRCFYLTNPKNEIIATRVAEQIPLLKKGRERRKSAAFYAIYIVLDQAYRGGNNIPVEMYIASLIDAAENSYKTGKKVKYLVAECSSATERLQNKIGLKRVYLRSGGILKELEFYQPPMEFDSVTGSPTSEESAEHFMLYKTNGTLVTKKNVYDAVSSLLNMYRSNHPTKYFTREEAFLAHEKLFEDKLNTLRQQLDACSEVMLLSKDERPLGVIEFEAADRVY